MSSSLGRFKVVEVEWVGRHALAVAIESDFTDRYFQMYSGRSLVGISRSAGQMFVVGQVDPTSSPAPITIVMVDETDHDTDFGSSLPRRPWNSYRVEWPGEDDDDTKWFAAFASPAAGDPVDYGTILGREAYIGEGAYSFDLPAFDECGTFTAGVVSIDNALPDGNASDPIEVDVEAQVYPPDVAIGDTGRRLTPAIAAGLLTVGFEYDWPA